MAVSSALSAGDQTNLAGPSALRRYLAVVPSTTIATARINQASFSYPLAQVTVDTTSGWSSVRAGMTVKIGSTSGASDRGIYRVRKVPDSTTLYLSEMGVGDAGLLAVDIKSSGFADNDYVTVLDRRDVWSVLPRIVYPGDGTIYEDYDLTAGTYNTTPPPIVNITINGFGTGGYATKIADGATKAMTLTATVLKFPVSQLSGSTLTYAWSGTSGWSGVSGGTTATLTGNAPPGNYTIRLTVTDSIGGATIAEREIIINDDATNPPIRLFTMPSADTRDRTGRRMSFSLNDNALASIPDGAMLIYYEMPTWNGTDVASATRMFPGWLLRHSRNTETGLRSADVDMVGPAGLMAMLKGTSQYLEYSSGPTTWQEIYPLNSMITFVAWYLLKWRADNLLRMFNYTPFSVERAGQGLPSWRVNPGTLLSQLQELADAAAGNFGCNSHGEMFLLRHPSMRNYATDRSSIVSRDSLTTARYNRATVERTLYPNTSQVRGEGFSWDGTTVLPTPYYSDAPQVPGQGQSGDKLAGQIISGQSELDQRTGDYYAFKNNPYSNVTVHIEKNRDVYEPAELPFVPVTIPAASSPDGVQWSKNCIPLSVSKRHMDGMADIDMTAEAETHGMAGVAVPVPNDDNWNPETPDPEIIVPIIDPLPDDDYYGDDYDYNPDDDDQKSPKPTDPTAYGRIFIGADSCRITRGKWAPSGTFAVENICPTSSVRAVMGDVIKLEHDSANYKKLWAYCTQGLIYTPDCTASTVRWTTPIVSAAAAAFDDCASTDLTVAAGGIAGASLPYSYPGASYDALSIGTFSTGTGWTGSSQLPDTGSGYIYGVAIEITPSCPLKFGGYDVTITASGTQTVYMEVLYQKIADSTWTSGSGGNTVITAGSHTYSKSEGTSTFYAQKIAIVLRIAYGGSPPPSDTFILTAIDLANCTFLDCGAVAANEGLISDFHSLQDCEGGYVWLTKRDVSGTSYVFFNRTYNNFRDEPRRTQIARWAADMSYTIAPNKHNYMEVYVTAGDPAQSDAYVYKSVNGGETFTATACSILTKGGQLYWGWSTGTPNTPNTSETTALNIIRGLDGSNNLKFRRGTSGSDVTIANGSGKYGVGYGALWVEDRDSDYLTVVLQDGTVYKSTNGGTSFSSATSLSGTQPFGGEGYPSGDGFLLAFGDEQLEFSTDSASTWTDLYTTYATLCSGSYSSEGTTIYSAVPDLSQHYPVPVGSS